MSKPICQIHVSPQLLEFLFFYFKALVPTKSYLLPFSFLCILPLKYKKPQEDLGKKLAGKEEAHAYLIFAIKLNLKAVSYSELHCVVFLVA